MSTPSDPRTLVMHGLRLKGFAEAASVAEAVGLAGSVAEPILEELVGGGAATHREGRISGFSLTPAGRVEHAELLAAELDAAGVRGQVEAAYRRFLGHNTDLLAICTAWQLREVDGQSTPNDHSDPDYDAAVVARLASLHGHAEPICGELADALDRYCHYGPRLSHALERVQSGDTDWFTKPMLASYHTIWFELHEDLLATLGIERGSEEHA
ncbi:MAG: transcriptional regulator [Acidimicrobiales bacterium]